MIGNRADIIAHPRNTYLRLPAPVPRRAAYLPVVYFCTICLVDLSPWAAEEHCHAVIVKPLPGKYGCRACRGCYSGRDCERLAWLRSAS
jgi:hypothetical protein